MRRKGIDMAKGDRWKAILRRHGYDISQVAERVSFSEAMEAVRDYLLNLEGIFKNEMVGGPFEQGGVKWNLPMPFNFRTTYFEGSLLDGLFGKVVTPSNVQVIPLASGYIPTIIIDTEKDGKAELELKKGILHYNVWISAEDEDRSDFVVRLHKGTVSVDGLQRESGGYLVTKQVQMDT